MRKTFIAIIAAVVAALAISCAEDKGNYDYHAINEVTIYVKHIVMRSESTCQ